MATVDQSPRTSEYNALSVPTKPAGGTYLDPTTGVKVYKLTSNTFPATGSWGHDYSEGGDEVSLPHTGPTRSVLVYNGGSHWLIDFTPGQGVSKARQLTGSLAPRFDVAFAFSNNPATPYYAYVSNGSSIRRFDVRTLTEVPGGGFPVTGETDAIWLHQSENDGFFVWMRGANGSTVVGYDPATSTKKLYTNGGLNEPHVDRAGRYVGLSMTSPANGLIVWDWLNNSTLWSWSGDPGIPYAHTGSLRGGFIGVDWNMSYPPDFTYFPSVGPVPVHIGGPANATEVHCNGNWIQRPANPADQWALCSGYGALVPSNQWGTPWLSPGGIVLLTRAGERRLLAHEYNTTSNYTFLGFPKFSSDGRYVLFTSDMNGSARSDLFIAELP